MTRDPVVHAARKAEQHKAEQQADWNQNKSRVKAHATVTAVIGVAFA